ncbi:response regulator [Pseudomonas sp. NA-150]|uniref:response regulator n=1 Tax=Pseudomonas sp. NA-150 TaxID=3367525 RepID=UPI0037CBADF0
MSKVSVLVVDDAPFIRDLVKKGLRNYFPGIQIEDAINGRKAQILLERETFDMVLCDWEMPEMSGLELLTWCRQQESLKTMPFIMVTSRGDKENVVQAIQAGVTDFIGKPFTNEQLLTKVKKALAKVGKLDALMAGAPTKMNSAFANDSLSALTGGKAEVIKPAVRPASVGLLDQIARASGPAGSAPAAPTAPAAAPSVAASGRGQGQLRLPSGNQQCVIKALSLKEALLVVRRGEVLPQVLDSAVLDLEQGENAEIARLNGYLHAVVAYEPKPDSDWLQLTFRFVDQDAQKLDYVSRLIARGTAQKHFVPGG